MGVEGGKHFGEVLKHLKEKGIGVNGKRTGEHLSERSISEHTGERKRRSFVEGNQMVGVLQGL